jgi:hypothetical protein
MNLLDTTESFTESIGSALTLSLVLLNIHGCNGFLSSIVSSMGLSRAGIATVDESLANFSLTCSWFDETCVDTSEATFLFLFL